MERTVQIPDDVDVSQDGTELSLNAGGETVTKEFDYPTVDVSVSDDAVTISTESSRRNDRAVVGTYASHVNNMVEGVTEGFTYTLKTVFAHFPMTVKTEGDQVLIQNFIGERAPRRIDIMPEASVDVNDDEVVVTGPDKEHVAQTASRIEQACHKGSRDPRKFQDGVYLVSTGEE